METHWKCFMCLALWTITVTQQPDFMPFRDLLQCPFCGATKHVRKIEIRKVALSVRYVVEVSSTSDKEAKRFATEMQSAWETPGVVDASLEHCEVIEE